LSTASLRSFSKKGDERGVRVEEDEVGDYRIEIRVILRFGVNSPQSLQRFKNASPSRSRR